MAKNIIFNDTTYPVDESKLSSATTELQSHLSTAMNGSGATINFGGTAYNIDSTKLSTATNIFVSHLKTVEGDDSQVVVGGVAYSVDASKLANAVEDMHSTLSGLAEPTIQPSQGLEYRLNHTETGYIVCGLGTCTDTNLNIPSTHNGLPVLELGDEDWIISGSQVTTVVIPDSVEYIGASSLADCATLTSITLGANVAYVSPIAFHSNPSLQHIYIKQVAEHSTLTPQQWSAEYNTDYEDEDYIPESPLVDHVTIHWNSTGPEEEPTDPEEPVEPALPASEGLDFELNEDGVSYAVCGIGTCEDTDIVIPNTYRGLPVTDLRSWAFGGSTAEDGSDQIISIVIPNSITNIPECAFAQCPNLVKVTMGNGVTNIGVDAFYYCSKLTSVTIPNTVTSIGDGAFSYCYSLTSITIPEGVISIGGSAFGSCSSLTSITIPDSVTNIGPSAFRDCSSLTSVTIGNGVTSIGYSAFSLCGITDINIPSSVINIDDGAFYNCTKLTHINVDADNDTYTSIDGNLYSKDEKTLIQYTMGKQDESMTIPNTVENIASYAFGNCNNLTNITIPDGIVDIGNYAFRGCTKLINIVIPDNVTRIGNGVFYECSNLTTIDIPDNITIIPEEMFYGCFGLTNIIIPSQVTSIGSHAFHRCKSLTSIIIPDSVTSIGSAAFGYCSGLTSIDIPNGITNINYGTFEYCTGLTSVTIPEGVTNIGDYAFTSTGLTSVTIPEGVTNIGDYAFRSTSLVEIIIPSSVISIAYNTFSRCYSLKYIFINKPKDSISRAPWGAEATIYWKDEEQHVYELNADGQSYSVIGHPDDASVINIPDTFFGVPVTRICNNAFENCTNLYSITVGNNVTIIEENAFSGCDYLDINIPKNRDSIAGAPWGVENAGVYWADEEVYYGSYGEEE